MVFEFNFFIVRLEPILIELEKEQEDLLIVSHASVIRCLLAYLIGLPATEIPAIEIARGDLIEVCISALQMRCLTHLSGRLFLRRTVCTAEPSTSGTDQVADTMTRSQTTILRT